MDFNADRKQILTRLDEAFKVIRQINHDYKIDVIRNVQYKELAVVDLINDAMRLNLMNTMQFTGDDAYGTMYEGQANEIVEIKTAQIKPFGSVSILFDKQEQEEKRKYTLECGGLLVGIFRPDEIFPVYVMVPRLIGDARIKWQELLKARQDEYLKTLIESQGTTTNKWQSISVKAVEIVETVGGENCSFVMRNGNILSWEQFKDTFPRKRKR